MERRSENSQEWKLSRWSLVDHCEVLAFTLKEMRVIGGFPAEVHSDLIYV